MSASAAHAQANLAFSGGSGTRLTVSLLTPVTYTITAASTTTPFFTFDGVGNILSQGSPFTGTWTFTVNGGAPVSLTRISSGYANFNTTADDLSVNTGLTLSLAAGDIVTLNAATVTTTNNVAAAAPANTAYCTFVTRGDGAAISSNGVSGAVVPEAGTALFLGLALPIAGTMATAHRRK